MNLMDWAVEISGMAMACFLLGFCGSAGMVTAFWLTSKWFEDEDDKHGVIGH